MVRLCISNIYFFSYSLFVIPAPTFVSVNFSRNPLLLFTVEINKVLGSMGLYAIIRHPMYVAVLMMYVLSPLVLGSYCAVLAVLPLPVLVIFRIKSEEKILRDKLPGYREYTQKVKYRLIPYIW